MCHRIKPKGVSGLISISLTTSTLGLVLETSLTIWKKFACSASDKVWVLTHINDSMAQTSITRSPMFQRSRAPFWRSLMPSICVTKAYLSVRLVPETIEKESVRYLSKSSTRFRCRCSAKMIHQVNLTEATCLIATVTICTTDLTEYQKWVIIRCHSLITMQVVKISYNRIKTTMNLFQILWLKVPNRNLSSLIQPFFKVPARIITKSISV